jgi:hypothetical protein
MVSLSDVALHLPQNNREVMLSFLMPHIRRQGMSLCPVVGDADFDHLVKTVTLGYSVS